MVHRRGKLLGALSCRGNLFIPSLLDAHAFPVALFFYPLLHDLHFFNLRPLGMQFFVLEFRICANLDVQRIAALEFGQRKRLFRRGLGLGALHALVIGVAHSVGLRLETLDLRRLPRYGGIARALRRELHLGHRLGLGRDALHVRPSGGMIPEDIVAEIDARIHGANLNINRLTPLQTLERIRRAGYLFLLFRVLHVLAV